MRAVATSVFVFGFLFSIGTGCTFLLTEGEASGNADAGEADGGMQCTPQCGLTEKCIAGMCRGECVADAGCDGDGVCDVREGVCVEPSKVVFVAASGIGSPSCGDVTAAQEPCSTLRGGLAAADTLARSFVRIVPGDGELVGSLEIGATKSVRVLGFGATLRGSQGGDVVITLLKGSEVSFEGLNIFPPSNVGTNPAIRVEPGGKVSLYRCLLEGHGGAAVIAQGTAGDADDTHVVIEASVIRGNAVSAAAVAVSVTDAFFSIRNTEISKNNGRGFSYSVGNVTEKVVLGFNTIAGNMLRTQCAADSQGGVEFVGNLFEQALDGCAQGKFQHSWVPGDEQPPNLTEAPSFVNASEGNYRLTRLSSGRNVEALEAFGRPGDVDAAGRRRPKEDAYEAGAFEFLPMMAR